MSEIQTCTASTCTHSLQPLYVWKYTSHNCFHAICGSVSRSLRQCAAQVGYLTPVTANKGVPTLRCYRATQTPRCCFLCLFPSAVKLLLLSILRYVFDGYTFRPCLYSLLYIISLSIPRPQSDDESSQDCLKALLALAAPPQPGTS